MTSTTRARKTTAEKAVDTGGSATQPPEDTTGIAPEPAAEKTSPTASAPQAPEAAPLEPPIVDAAPEPPAAPEYVSPTEVIPDVLADIILDDATKQFPADVDAVFQPTTPYGSTLVCTVRLIERTFLGPHRNPVERLLQPKGAHVSEGVAARIRERLLAQAAATAEK
jgi:hypothetical protein